MKNASSTFIKGWYAVLPSRQLKSSKTPFALERFSHPLVLWRDQSGQVVAMFDRCPHRGAKLSLGKVCKNIIRCPYHGYEFHADGPCHFSPEFNQALPGLKAGTLPTREHLGMIWIFWGGEQADDFYSDDLDRVHTAFKGQYSQLERTWHSHATYCIENQLDYTHLQSVHHNTIGRGFSMPKNPRVVETARGINVFLDADIAASQLFFPNVWLLNIGDKIKLMVFFAPINEVSTQLYVRSYRRFLTFKPLKPLFDKIFNQANRIILKQDERVVCSQGSSPSYLAKEDKLMTHDKAVKCFREHWRRELGLK